MVVENIRFATEGNAMIVAGENAPADLAEVRHMVAVVGRNLVGEGVVGMAVAAVDMEVVVDEHHMNFEDMDFGLAGIADMAGENDEVVFVEGIQTAGQVQPAVRHMVDSYDMTFLRCDCSVRNICLQM